MDKLLICYLNVLSVLCICELAQICVYTRTYVRTHTVLCVCTRTNIREYILNYVHSNDFMCNNKDDLLLNTNEDP